MHLELSELLACPDCGPRHGVVVSVDRMEDRRVLEGFLSCPTCEARFPIHGGVIDFGPRGDRTSDREGGGRSSGSGPAPLPSAPGPDDGLRVAALLDLTEGGGFVLLGRGLSGVAAGVARMATGVELVTLADAPEPAATPEPAAAGRISPARGVSEASLPLRDLRLRGAVLLGGHAEELAEATRAVRPGGRVVVLRPSAGMAEAAAGLPLDVVAAEESAIVAVRR